MRDTLQPVLERIFPERREIILRSEGRVRYVLLGRPLQVCLAAALVGAVGWSVFATAGYLGAAKRAAVVADHQRLLDEKDRQIAAWRLARERLVVTLEGYRQENETVAQSLSENKQEVERLSRLNEELDERLAAVGVRLASSVAAREAAEAARRDLQARLATLETELSDIGVTKRVAEARLKTVGQLLSSTVADRGRLEEERDDLEAQLASLRQSVDGLHGTREQLRAELVQTESALDMATQDRDRILGERAELETQLGGFQEQVAALQADRGQLESRLRAAESDLWSEVEQRSRVAFERDRLQSRLTELQRELATLTGNGDSVPEDLEESATQVSGLVEDRDRLVEERDTLAGHNEELEGRLEALQSAQRRVIERLEAQAADSIATIEQAVAITGLDLEQMLLRTQRLVGQGGPFVPVLPSGEPGADLANGLVALEARVEQWQGLQDLLAQLPLAAPLDGYNITSPYGRRKDPITKRIAMHHGLDFRAPPRSPIYASAPGRVTFVGWKGSYGKFVEVDHGLGVRTRYGHLNKILVERGQEIAFRDRVGLVGSTGRSTGPHLHYEILVDGRPRDPLSFMRAGQYVFKR